MRIRARKMEILGSIFTYSETNFYRKVVKTAAEWRERMKSFVAFMKKEWMESVRSGKIVILIILFILLGILGPAIAKLTPWMLKMMEDSLAEAGLIVTEVPVNALTSWTQFFKNIPMGCIVFACIYSGIFTREYQAGTLILMLTKGLSRWKVMLGKYTLVFFIWTFCYWLCFTITYGYNAYFWDNRIASDLFFAAALWWLFGVWVISLITFFSVICKSNTGVLLGTGGSVLVSYVVGLFPKVKAFTPAMLMDAMPLLSGAAEMDAYKDAVYVTVILCILLVGASVPLFNKKNI